MTTIYDEPFITGTDQKVRVHRGVDCDPGSGCLVHAPSSHSMVGFPLHWRYDRRIFERICSHGVGHPDPDEMAYREANGLDDADGVHGCDGCCASA